jgi:hypothetical protein
MGTWLPLGIRWVSVITSTQSEGQIRRARENEGMYSNHQTTIGACRLLLTGPAPQPDMYTLQPVPAFRSPIPIS